MKRLLDRSITLLVLPPADLPTWRAQIKLRVLLGLLSAWTVLTLWLGFRAARQVDYLATKADNGVLRMRMARLVDEIENSQTDLAKARSADKQLRRLLEMPDKRAIIESDDREQGQGGPTAWERRDILRRFAEDPAHESPEAVEASMISLVSQSRAQVQSTQEIFQYVGHKRSLFRATPLGWPTQGRITSNYGYRLSPMRRFRLRSSEDEDEDDDEFHPGLDIANKKGTPIVATADGTVERAGWAGGYGKLVMLRHEHGYKTLYGHTSELLVGVGAKVKRGQTIALMGSTGRSTGAHVHYEVWRNDKRINPTAFLKRQ